MGREGALWIGALEPYMTEEFLRNALNLMGEGENLVSIKVIKNKFTGEPASYGFINFESDPSALMAMHKLNGKIIPNSLPPVRFQLNHASAKTSGNGYSQREFSIWVADLPPTITEETLRRTFATRYESVKMVKVIEEADERMYGFVRFTDQNDQRDALIHMNGFVGLDKKPMKVTMAIPKHSLSGIARAADAEEEYSYMYESYWADRAAWGNYSSYQGAGPGGGPGPGTTAQSNKFFSERPSFLTSGTEVIDFELLDSDEDDRIVEHDLPLNVDAMNTEYIAKSEEVWKAIEKDRWLYNLDDEGFVPKVRTEKELKKVDKMSA